ncbi:hypothetical protein [Mesorhizobium sp. M0579]|uniref:hypothetical protein n=1 Tax=Mesorhizobium sp. M0579 TaxID=2956962 RepID=UPI00333C365C
MFIDRTKALLMIGPALHLRDVIEHDNKLLIVVLWYANLAAGLRRPECVIPLASVPHEINETDPKFPRYLVDGIFPESLFLGTASENELQQYGVQKGPNATFPILSPTRH